MRELNVDALCSVTLLALCGHHEFKEICLCFFVCCIKVLGSGCKACHQLYDNTVKAVEGMGIEVEYVTDLQKIMEYGAMSMPALVINEKLVSSGKTLKPAEISELIKNFVKN